jgi:hypothetical protein
MPIDSLPAPDAALLKLAHALRDAGYHFITTTPTTHERVNARAENQWAQDLRGVFGWSRPFRDGVLPPEIFELQARRKYLRLAGKAKAAAGAAACGFRV